VEHELGVIYQNNWGCTRLAAMLVYYEKDN